MKQAISQLKERIEKTIQHVQTEEATKNAFIMPFLQALGYDVFNPTEVVPEFTADIGTKTGEKVDYAIMIGGMPMILIECKQCANELNVQNESQLLRYFNVTKAKFGILTNGLVYQFYTDLEEPNIMDLKPFLSFDVRECDKINYTELEKFKKDVFDAENVRKTAETLKYTGEIKRIIAEEFASPSEELVRLIYKRMMPGSIFNDKKKARLLPLVKAALDGVISEKVKSSLDAALKTTQEVQQAKEEEIPQSVFGADTGIVTTQEEIDAHLIVKAICAELVPPEKVVMRDAKTYCAILYDDNNRRPICRFLFGTSGKKSIVFFDGPKEEKILINDIQDIYQYKERLLGAIRKYIAPTE